MTILFVSGNKNKVIEINRILENLSLTNKIPIIKHYKLDLPEIQSDNHIQVSLDKCKTASININSTNQSYTGILTEDVSLCFNALNGLPGTFIKFFLKNLGNNNLYKLLDGFQDKRAYALCTYTYYQLSNNTYTSCYSKVDGIIVEPRGSKNFGWDSIFQPTNSNLTFAEMTLEQKDSCSHRTEALKKLLPLILN